MVMDKLCRMICEVFIRLTRRYEPEIVGSSSLIVANTSRLIYI